MKSVRVFELAYVCDVMDECSVLEPKYEHFATSNDINKELGPTCGYK